MDFSTFYFSPGGRVSRRDYWLRMQVPAMVVGPICRIVDSQLALHFQAGNFSLGVAATAFTVLLSWPATVVQVKRLHDTNKSGWWIVAVATVNLAYGVTLANLPDGSTDVRLSVLLWVGACVDFAFFYFVGLKPGDRGPNRFGGDPIYEKANETGLVL